MFVRFLVVATVILGNIGAWAMLNRPEPEVPWTGLINGVSFSPYRLDDNPFEARYPTIEEIEQDIELLAGKVSKLRTYSSLDGLEEVPRLAQRHDLTVTAGAWLDADLERNEREIINLIRNARQYRNIDRAIIGNEVLLRDDLSVKQLRDYLRQVRKEAKIPVSTAEPWHVWLKHPELAREVDFIAIHILPYWEGVRAEESLDFVLERYRQVRRAFPGKPVLIAEVGWPSQGQRRMQSRPSVAEQAHLLRRFFNVASAHQIDYFVMEAFDQPWKEESEGSVGPYWGLYDVDRQPKFALSGPIEDNPHWELQALFAVLFALLPMIWIFWRWNALRARGQLFLALLVQLAASTLAWTAFTPLTQSVGLSGWLMWGLLLPTQLVLIVVVMINGFELAELSWPRRWRRQFTRLMPQPGQRLPKVSLHLAICNEPPELVIQTLDSLARLDYPDFEVIVVDNNTRDPRLWAPVEAHCRILGERFRFFSLGKWPGFKAGALNFALRQTDPAAEVIGVIDSDYIVRADWLRSLVPYFDNPSVGFVQAPQDHREWQGDRFKTMCNWEYAGFFHIGMVHRNEYNAIIQHGTMTLIRRAALERLDGWSEWSICEDAELGLRLFETGYEAVYVNEIFGQGLTAHSFAAYKGQRFRWAYGAVQILKRHWRALLPGGGSRLSGAQRLHFALGWAPWFADGLHLLFTCAALLWTLGLVLVPQRIEFPLLEYILPMIAVFAFRVGHSLWLYTLRVPCSLNQRLGAAIAGMALTHAIGRAMLQGLFTSGLPFLRTPKAEDKPALIQGLAMAREEGLIALGLWCGVWAMLSLFGAEHEEAMLWSLALAVQSLPYLAAVCLSLVNALSGLRVRAPLPVAPTGPRVTNP